MIVQQEFECLPPKPFMMQILDAITKTYVFLWDRKDAYNCITMTWKELTHHYNKNSFRSNLRKLNNKGLLSYEECCDGISIELVGWDEVE